MRKSTLSLTLALASFVLPLLLSAQTDSSRYDVGNVSLNKAFTQAVTIRGEDLEKMPFMNLSDAISAWLLGIYSEPGVLVYVVDGNPVTDVNLYPIYDIAEVTFLPNAVAAAGYGNGLQEVVLITTRRGKERDGVRLAAQTGLIKGGQYQGSTHTGFYHQYYIGVRHTAGKLSYGVSADWQQDEIASVLSTSLLQYTPPLLQRWRLNGRVEWRPDEQNAIRLTVGYAPQRVGYTVNSPGGGYQYHYSDWWYHHLLVPELSWQGHWSSGIRNKFDAEYLYSWTRLRYDETDTVNNNGTAVWASGFSQSTGKNAHLVLRDRLSYEANAGNWKIAPAIDISYQRVDEHGDYRGFNPFATPTSNYSAIGEAKGSLFYLIPSADLTLARALDIGAGAMVNASSKTGSGNRRLFPFVTAGLDLLHLGSETGGGSLKLFGSYARRPLLYITDYTLSDLSSTGSNYGNYSLTQLYWGMPGYDVVNGVQNTGWPLAGVEPGYWTWATGVAYKTANERLSVQYSFERRNFSFFLSTDNGISGFEPWVETLHHADLRIKVIESKKAGWVTGFNVSVMHNSGDTLGFQQAGVGAGTPIGDLYTQGNSWTGGWVNRLRFGAFAAGLDLLYHFGETAPVYSFSGTQIGKERINSVLVPNVYCGWRWNPGPRVLELFIEGRGLLGNKDSDLPDVRRFYTVGGKWGL